MTHCPLAQPVCTDSPSSKCGNRTHLPPHLPIASFLHTIHRTSQTPPSCVHIHTSSHCTYTPESNEQHKLEESGAQYTSTCFIYNTSTCFIYNTSTCFIYTSTCFIYTSTCFIYRHQPCSNAMHTMIPLTQLVLPVGAVGGSFLIVLGLGLGYLRTHPPSG